MRYSLLALSIALAAMPLAETFAQAQVSEARCDRACLQAYVARYVDALAARDPSRLPLTAEARFTENGAEIPLGEGLWFGASAVGNRYRYDYVDTESGQVASHLNFTENGRSGLMSLRLKIVDGQISEIETVLNRGARLADVMVPTEPLWDLPEPAATRLTREQLAAVAESYLTAVASSDGSRAPFDPETCVRLENGGVMAHAPNDDPPQPGPDPATTQPWMRMVIATLGIGCAEQLDTGIYRFITSYNNARFPIIDVERQIVFGQWNFRRRGDVTGVEYAGAFIPFMDSTQFPNENLLGQAFKIRGGKIVRVQGVFFNANVYKAGTGWGPGRDGPVADAR